MSEQKSGSEAKHVGNVTYQDVESGYIEQRQLKKAAGWILLWAMGVGAVISGDFFGWNFGLSAGGFGGLLIATFFIAIMYVCMVFCIAELSTALPHAGGFYSFTRNAFGPGLAYLNSVTDMVEYVITPAVIVVGIGGYMDTLIPGIPAPVWWLIFYAVFVGINIWGTELTFRVSLIVTIAAMAVLVVFYIGSFLSGAFSFENVLNIPSGGLPEAATGAIALRPEAAESTWLPAGWYGVFAALPFAIWFYLAIEQLPLSAEESHDVVNDMPRALILGIVTLLALSVFTLLLNSGIKSTPMTEDQAVRVVQINAAAENANAAAASAEADGADADAIQAAYDAAYVIDGEPISEDMFNDARAAYNESIGGAWMVAEHGAPLEPGFRAIFGSGATTTFLTLIGLTGLIASFHSIIYAYGRVLFACSRAGYIPRWISVTGERKTPARALILGAVVGYVIALILQFFASDTPVGAALLTMAVFGAVISYALVMISYIAFNRKRPDLPRPYKSPLGDAGAWVGTILSVIAGLAAFAIEGNRPGVYGTAIFVILGFVYYWFYSRHHLVAQAPEEEIALMIAAQKELK